MTARKRTDRPFVKSADTTAKAENSRAEVERMLVRYGASGFAYQRDLEQHTITLQFVIPDSAEKGAPRVPVTLPVSVRRVYDVLYGRPMRYAQKPEGGWGNVYDPKGYDAKKLEQAERVAWRNLVLWVDAALSAASIGMQTITEAFLAHTMVVDDGGQATRMMDYLGHVGGALGPGVRALLPPPKGD